MNEQLLRRKSRVDIGSAGTLPFRPTLFCKNMARRDVILLSSGSEPASLLLCMKRPSSFDRLLTWDGSEPVTKEFEKLSSVSAVKRPTSVGTVGHALSDKSNNVSPVKPANADPLTMPVKPELSMSSVTRPAPHDSASSTPARVGHDSFLAKLGQRGAAQFKLAHSDFASNWSLSSLSTCAATQARRIKTSLADTYCTDEARSATEADHGVAHAVMQTCAAFNQFVDTELGEPIWFPECDSMTPQPPADNPCAAPVGGFHAVVVVGYHFVGFDRLWRRATL